MARALVYACVYVCVCETNNSPAGYPERYITVPTGMELVGVGETQRVVWATERGPPASLINVDSDDYIDWLKLTTADM